MNIRKKLLLAIAPLAAVGFAAPAAAADVTIVPAKCVSVADAAGCYYTGNITAGTTAETETQYNALRSPDIDLNFITKSDDGNFANFGSITNSGGTSGLWNLPGFTVDYIAVKAGAAFVLYSVGGVSSGNWSTAGLVNNNGQLRGLSHLAFFGSQNSPVPEPATWAMMLAGFGAVGFSMRARRQNRFHGVQAV